MIDFSAVIKELYDYNQPINLLAVTLEVHTLLTVEVGLQRTTTAEQS